MAFFCPAGLEWVPGCASGRIAGPDRDSLGSQGAPWGCPKVMKFAYLKYFNSYMVKPCSKHVETQLFFPESPWWEVEDIDLLSVIREREIKYPTNVEQPPRCSSWARTRWATRWRPYRLQPWSTPVWRGQLPSQDGMLESDGNEKNAGICVWYFEDIILTVNWNDIYRFKRSKQKLIFYWCY